MQKLPNPEAKANSGWTGDIRALLLNLLASLQIIFSSEYECVYDETYKALVF